MRMHSFAALLLTVALSCSACGGSNEVTEADKRDATAQMVARVEDMNRWVREVVACMEGRGWTNLEVRNEGTADVWISFGDYPLEQQEALARDDETCMAQVKAVEEPTLTPAIAAVYYEDRLRVAQCLRDAGYDISEAPTLETFTEDVLAQESAWEPRGEAALQNLDVASTGTFETLCNYVY